MAEPTIMIVSGEASGDLHGGELARALLRRRPGLRLVGMGAERMRAAGVDVFFDNRELGVMGLVEVFRKAGAILRAYRAVKAALAGRGVDLVVLIDSPDFNLRVARAAKRMGVPTVYYIGPKIWAWRSGRLKTVARWVDRMLVIFPFEEALYRAAGVDCEYVGHPLVDEIPEPPDRALLRSEWGIPEESIVIALLPGSRRMEVARLLEPMAEAMGRIREIYPDARAVIPVASSLSTGEIRACLGSRADGIRLVSGQAPRVLAAADSAMVASGTATLEAALVGTPFVAVYKVALLTEMAGRLLVKIRTVCPVNIVAGRMVVPELLQRDASPEKLARAVLGQIQDRKTAEEVKKGLEEVRKKLGAPGAAARAAAAILGLLSPAPRTEAA